MTAPLTPPDCDLRGMPFMPLAGDRLMDSDLFLLSTGDEFKAALALWWASWKQVPAASLPNDDRLLAGLARVDLKRWMRMRAVSLRGFELCEDGRLYHPVVAEKAAEAWSARQKQRAKANKRWQKPETEPGSPAASAVGDATALPLDMQGTGTGTVKGSEPNGSGAVAPIDPEKKAWDDGTQLLTTAGLMSVGSAKSLLGKLKKDHGITLAQLLPAISQAIANGTQDPASYLRKAAQGIESRRSGGGMATQPTDEPDTDAQWTWRLQQLDGPQRIWIESMYGPRPGERGCRVPAHLLEGR